MRQLVDNITRDRMEPQVTRAECLLSFDLSDKFTASLFGNIESPGAIQYHYLLVVFGQDTKPCFFVGSEWSRLDPSYKDEPVLGAFTADGHSNFGGSAIWRDEYLFLLRAVEVARGQIQLKEGSLTQGEAWALTRILERVKQHPDAPAPDSTNAAYREALSRNDGRIAAFLKSSNRKQDGFSAPVITQNSTVDAVRSAVQDPRDEEAASKAKKHAELLESAKRRAMDVAMARGLVPVTMLQTPSEPQVTLTPSQQEWIKFSAGGFLTLEQFDELWISGTGKTLGEHDKATIAAAVALMNSPDIVYADNELDWLKK
jgi:hypothetical protein